MAYAPEDPNNKQQQQQQDQQPEPAMTSSAPGAGPGSPAGKSTAPQATPSQPFQNLQAYLSANAPQVNQQAGQISSNLNTQYGQLQSDVNAAGSEFGNQVSAGYAHPNPELTNQAAANPASFVSNPGNVAAFQSLYNDTYTGPRNFEGTSPYGELSSKITTAANNASNFKTLPGMQNYFASNNPTATKGDNTLDAVLLRGNRGAYQQVADTAKQFETLPGYLSNAAAEANKGVSEAQQAAGNESARLREQFTGQQGVIPTAQADFSERLDQARGGAQSSADRIRDLFSNISKKRGVDLFPLIDALKPEDFSDLGITRPQLISYAANNSIAQQEGVPFDSLNYLHQQVPDVQINPANFASRNDYDTASALTQLTGQDLSSWLNQANIDQSGTFNPTNPNISDFSYVGAYNALVDLLNQVPPSKAIFTNLPKVDEQGNVIRK